ncbi:MAG: 50S ribosomal protein L32 [Puniceicoccales bacterium]|jgi:large subunit ribosomal protein L32|nr:50S ribosomal protein L32 [Puniceicoccales bacterium]
MGQPKRKQSKMRSRLRRGANNFKMPQLVKDSTEGNWVMRHRVSVHTGTYRNRQVVEVDL